MTMVMEDHVQNQDAAGRPVATRPARPERSVLERTAVGLGWIVGWRMATRVLGLLSTLVLIRLLAPGDFGLVALASTFVIAVDTLSALGVEDSLVREPHPTPAMYDTAFTLNALRSGVTAVLLAAAALPVAAFFGEPRLAHVLWALAAGTVIAGAGSIGVVDFRRNIDFGKEFALQILPRVLSIVITVSAALIWHSYWALVAGILVGRAVRTGFSYRMHPWRPRLDLSAWRYLIGFSAWSWAISMAELVRDRMNAFVLGRTLDATAVGIYSIGEEIASLPATELVGPLCRSCFSGFAADRAAGHGVAETFLRPVALTFLVTLPTGIGLSLVADPLVRLAVGEAWAGAIPVIQVLGAMGAFVVFGCIASTLLSAHAMLRRQFAVTLGCLLLRLALVVPLVNAYGVLGAALGVLAGTVVDQSLYMAMAFRSFGIPAGELLRRTWRSAAAAAAMAAVLAAAGLGWAAAPGSEAHLVQALASAAGLGAGTYGLALLALWLLSGRPAGAEADLLALARRLAKGILRRAFLAGPDRHGPARPAKALP